MIPILMYHSIQRVSRHEPMRSIHVDPRRFHQQMWILKTLGYEGCTVSHAINALKSESKQKLVALTFDDGYLNFISNALPTLNAFNFKATVYAVSNLTGDYNQWDLGTGISPNKLMDNNQLKICISNGMEIGCHTAHHASLTDKHTDLNAEVHQSKSHLENQLQISVNAFCYPYGHMNNKTILEVKKAGFTSATTMVRSRAKPSDDLFQLPRIPVTWHTLPHLFIAKILTSYEDRRRHA